MADTLKIAQDTVKELENNKNGAVSYTIETMDEYRDIISSMLSTAIYTKMKERSFTNDQIGKLMEFSISYGIDLFDNAKSFKYKDICDEVEKYINENLVEYEEE